MQLIILIPLVSMIVSDYRKRSVVLWQLLLFGMLVLTVSLVNYGLQPTSLNIATNMILSLLIGLSVYFYFLLKYKSVPPVIGKGDILFILFLTPFFTPRKFLIFMLVSFVATLLIWCICAVLRKRHVNIPLISGVGICLCILVTYQQLTHYL